jgi:PBP1b-binding outer membrane lipoprotein LpoB
MKTLMLLIALLLSGCRALPPIKKMSLEESVVGTYEKRNGGITYRFVFLDNGIFEANRNDSKVNELKWKVEDEQVHVGTWSAPNAIPINVLVYRIEPNGDLTRIAHIHDGNRERTRELTYKKTQYPSSTAAPKN